MTKKINNYSFEQLYNSLIINSKGTIEEEKSFIYSIKKCTTYDCRNDNYIKENILKEITNRSFILVSGPGNVGKTTFVKRIKNHIQCEIIQIDDLVAEYINNKNNNYNTKEIDIYLINNLERIIKDKSKLNKPVLLVGIFTDVLERAIIFQTLGTKYFEKNISIFILENNPTTIKKLYQSRCKDKNITSTDINIKYCIQKFKLQETKVKNGYLGFGADYSIVINTKISDEFI